MLNIDQRSSLVDHGRQLAQKLLDTQVVHNEKVNVACDAAVADYLATGFIEVMTLNGISVSFMCQWYTELENTGIHVITKTYNEPNDDYDAATWVVLRAANEPLGSTKAIVAMILSMHPSAVVTVASTNITDDFKADLLKSFPPRLQCKMSFTSVDLNDSVGVIPYDTIKPVGVPDIVKKRRRNLFTTN
jgi:hypothetical protein